MKQEDITKLVEAFKAKALQEVEDKRRNDEERRLKLQERRDQELAYLTEILPLVEGAMTLAESVWLDKKNCRILVEYLVPKHGSKGDHFLVSFYVECKTQLRYPENDERNGVFVLLPGELCIRPGEHGGYLNSWLWRTSGPAHEVLLTLCEFNGRAAARGYFDSSDQMK